MNKKLIAIIVVFVIIVSGAFVGFKALNLGKEEPKKESVKPEPNKSETENQVVIGKEKDEALLNIGRELNMMFDRLTLAKSEEEFDKLRKEMFVDYEFYAPMDEYDNNKYSNAETKVDNEKITKGESFFNYEFDYKTVKTLKDGTKENEEGHLNLEIVQVDDGTFKVTVVR
jgi:uncharacterized protein YxeA